MAVDGIWLLPAITIPVGLSVVASAMRRTRRHVTALVAEAGAMSELRHEAAVLGHDVVRLRERLEAVAGAAAARTVDR